MVSLVYSLNSHKKKFDRESSKIVFFEIRRYYEGITKFQFQSFCKKMNWRKNYTIGGMLFFYLSSIGWWHGLCPRTPMTI